jgi:methylenetetrahydrofolate reductase (NADPH)
VPVLKNAVVSAEISLPARPEGLRVRERIAALSETVDVVGLTDNHAGLPRMSPLAAVALAREQGVATVVHVSCRDRNRLALQSQVVGAAALGSEGILCLQGDPVPDVPHVASLATTELIAVAKEWAAPTDLAIGAVVNPFAIDKRRELRLLERKVAAGVDFVQTQMVFDVAGFERFLNTTAELLAGVTVFASVALLRDQKMADRARALPGCLLPDAAYARVVRGEGLRLAEELAHDLAALPGVDALHLFPLGAEPATREIAATFRSARGVPSRRR